MCGCHGARDCQHMNTQHMPKWRKHMSVTIFGRRPSPSLPEGLIEPAVSHAVWNIQDFDSCTKAAENRYVNNQIDSSQRNDEIRFCCDRSGGEWNSQTKRCQAPAAAQTNPTTPTLPPVVVPGGTIATRPGQATTQP